MPFFPVPFRQDFGQNRRNNIGKESNVSQIRVGVDGGGIAVEGIIEVVVLELLVVGRRPGLVGVVDLDFGAGREGEVEV